ncbi:MAG TPA: GNAT family N-acetyltransferase [Thermoanaerobaculia bacterium]|nr:GNAT family N-acetyltransferase [Thermoanaerobaculia bacterium]
MTVYRKAEASDATEIIRFQVEMARETEALELDRDTVTRGVTAVFDDLARGFYLVAEEAGVVIGSLMITYEWSDWRNGVVWWIQSVYVVPEHRRKGIYAGLYEEIKQLVERSNVRGLRLYVDHRNKSAQKVYERLGMTAEHYQMYEWMRE